LFPFSLRGRAKDWLLSLPRNSIDSWDKCKDAFIGKYYPPTKIIALRSDIMKFRQFDNEHVAQALEKSFNWICPENPFDESSEPKSVHKGSSKTHLNTIQFIFEKTYVVDLNASFDNTWFALSAPSSKALKKSTLGR
jgi:hypothetical protein